MNQETYGALKRIVEEAKKKRQAKCLNIDCVVNHQIGGNDIDLIEQWIEEVAKEYDTTNNKPIKLTKKQYIIYLIDCKGYTEEEARKYISVNGVAEIEKEAQAFNK